MKGMIFITTIFIGDLYFGIGPPPIGGAGLFRRPSKMAVTMKGSCMNSRRLMKVSGFDEPEGLDIKDRTVPEAGVLHVLDTEGVSHGLGQHDGRDGRFVLGENQEGRIAAIIELHSAGRDVRFEGHEVAAAGMLQGEDITPEGKRGRGLPAIRDLAARPPCGSFSLRVVRTLGERLMGGGQEEQGKGEKDMLIHAAVLSKVDGKERTRLPVDFKHQNPWCLMAPT